MTPEEVDLMMSVVTLTVVADEMEAEALCGLLRTMGSSVRTGEVIGRPRSEPTAEVLRSRGHPRFS